MRSPAPRQLRRLDEIARFLAKSTDLKEIKDLRGKAEAARHYAQSAALGLKIQNQAAELKLRAERRAGQLLSEMVPHGGDRKSSCHDGNLKLADLGINSQQSARWRREAAVPDDIFEQYVVATNSEGRDITAQGLLRLQRTLSSQRSALVGKSTGNLRRGRRPPRRPIPDGCATDTVQELFDELNNHRNLLEQILKPICSEKCTSIKLPEKRMIERVLRECAEIIGSLEESWRTKACNLSENASID
jgi:hypothetical protein